MDLESILLSKPGLSRNAKGQIGHNNYVKHECRMLKNEETAEKMKQAAAAKK